MAVAVAEEEDEAEEAEEERLASEEDIERLRRMFGGDPS